MVAGLDAGQPRRLMTGAPAARRAACRGLGGAAGGPIGPARPRLERHRRCSEFLWLHVALLLPGARARTTLPAGTRGRRVQGLLHSAEDGKHLVSVGDSKGAEHFGVGTTIDFRSPVAVYEQLAGILRQQIRDGMLPPDEQLPSQKDLVTTYKVARGTAAGL